MQPGHQQLKCRRPLRASGNRARAFSLLEVLVVIAAIGVVAAISFPAISNISSVAKESKSRSNAQRCAQVSATLAGMGVAHVIPQSMGGVEATVRLLREGVTVSHEVMTEGHFGVPGMSDEEIAKAADHLTIVYDTEELRLIYTGENQGEPPVAMGP